MIHRMQQVLGTLLLAWLLNVPISSAQETNLCPNPRDVESRQILAPSEAVIQQPIAPEFLTTSLPEWGIGQMPLAVKSEPVPPLPVFLYSKAELAEQQEEARTQAAKKFIEDVKSHKNPKITFMDKTWTGYNGRIVSIGVAEFTIQDDATKKLLGFNYADVSKLELMPSRAARAQETL